MHTGTKVMNKIWRPWVDTPEHDDRKTRRQRCMSYGQQDNGQGNNLQNLQFKHPVRLVWTKAVYDYMYASGETLLRNFPVQATIQVVDWDNESSDEEDEDEFESDDQDITKQCTQCKEMLNQCQKCRNCEEQENTK